MPPLKLSPTVFGLLPLLVFFLQYANAASTPAPLVVEPSRLWDGGDGPWSTWNLTIGTPPQKMRVTINTSGSGTWVILPDGCKVVSDAPSNCEEVRGDFFWQNRSATWKSASEAFGGGSDLYSVANYMGQLLALPVNGSVGFDTMNLDWADSAGKSVENAVIAGILQPEYALGQLGVAPWPTNFTDNETDSSTFKYSAKSYLRLLKENQMIPSLSYGLQVGSYSRWNQTGDYAFGSLIFGGYDSSRIARHDRRSGAEATSITIPMTRDVGLELVVLIQKITSENQSLLQDGVLSANLDTMQSDMWLPEATCQAFETAFGLEWNKERNHYYLHSDTHASLLERNASISFQLGSTADSNQSVNITLPYSAFDLTSRWPYTDTMPYFPLRRAANRSQYVLGRAFMQEVYLVSNYEKSTFTVGKAAWDPHARANVIPILLVDSVGGLSKGALAGIITGSVLGFLVLAAGAVFYFKKFAKRGSAAEKKEYHYEPPGNRHEIAADSTQIYEMPAERFEHEADWGAERVEIEGKEIVGEVFGSPVEVAQENMTDETPDVLSEDTPIKSAEDPDGHPVQVAPDTIVEWERRSSVERIPSHPLEEDISPLTLRAPTNRL